MTIKELTVQITRQAEEKKFGMRPEEINTLEKLALVHSEVSEAVDAYRKKRMDGKDGFAQELADIIIRVFHLAQIHKIDLETEISEKLEANNKREWKWEEYNETHKTES